MNIINGTPDAPNSEKSSLAVFAGDRISFSPNAAFEPDIKVVGAVTFLRFPLAQPDRPP
ncbi:hypothetical protein ACFPFP_10325 [Bradyrhizobium sp. GCM10023182]|uniref:Uncharacterized protein n=1 Tax=Bradyrhizobium zhengyangense TaxID=2911009 RepID=A0ABS9LKK8_9BRAD|nr:hypothetical protein [Bradyrhizobium zhengyangense]MCG2667339.1 hypothetical protein [Bradyrhizobium zhengyangense]